MNQKQLLLFTAWLGLAVAMNVVAAEPDYTAEQLHAELKWVGRDCTKPKVEPPKPLLTVTYDDYAKMSNDKNYKPQYVSHRRWIDNDGDGICEIYDVGMPEVSGEPSGKFYGYPTRVLGFKNGKWETISHLSLGWLPMVLTDKRAGRTYVFSSSYAGLSGDLGGWPLAKWGNSTFDSCELFREHIALAYMLTFYPPAELKTDELMFNNWTGGDQIFVVFPGVKALTENAKSLACIQPYLGVAALIDRRVRELYPTYFSADYPTRLK